jgi:hypothetical protein
MEWASTLYHAIAIANGNSYLVERERQRLVAERRMGIFPAFASAVEVDLSTEIAAFTAADGGVLDLSVELGGDLVEPVEAAVVELDLLKEGDGAGVRDGALPAASISLDLSVEPCDEPDVLPQSVALVSLDLSAGMDN